MAPVHSSQEFVRALKSASDPPIPEGPSKLEIAIQAWEDPSFYVPRKAEVIVDWILGRLLKDKSQAPSSNPILDPRLWDLVHDVISTDVALSSPRTRPSKTWLATLLHRVPIAPILMAFLDLLGRLDSCMRERLSQVVSSCLAIIWPLAVGKMSTEILLDCFGAYLSVVQCCETDESLVQIGNIVICSYEFSFCNSPNKKKIHHAFLQTYFHRWLESVMLESSPETQSLLELIYRAGIDTLFSLDVLRQARDSTSEDPIFDAVKSISTSNRKVLSCLPRLFASYVQTIQRHRGALFGQTMNQLPGAASEDMQASALRFFSSSESLLDAAESDTQKWLIKAALLRIVDQEGLYTRNRMGVPVLHHIVERAVGILGTVRTESTETTTCAVESLSTLMRIDYDFISPALPDILPNIMLACSSQTYITFLDLLLDYHSKTRTMNVFLAHLLSALSQQHIQGIAQSMRDVYQMSHSGPLLDPTFLAHLSKSLQTFLPGAQINSAMELLLQHLSDAWEHFHYAGEIDQVVKEEGPRKKRKTEVNTTSSLHPSASAISFSLSARIASVVVSSLAMQSVQQATLNEVKQKLSALRESFLHRMLTKTFKTIRKRAGNDVWSSEIVAAASLHLLYALEISHSSFLLSSDNSKMWKSVSYSLEDDGLLPELAVEIFRALFSQASSQDEAQFQALFDQTLSYIDRHFSASGSWSGQLHHLTLENQGRAKGPLALMHIIIEKWLPLIESRASRPQLEKLIRVIMSANITDSPKLSVVTGLHSSSLLGITLHSANFWEFPRMRVVLLEYMNEVTTILDGSTNSSSASRLSSAIAAYHLLLVFPVEYISRSSRTDFIKRAIVADDLFSRLSVDSDLPSNYLDQSLTVLRIFMKRVVTLVGYVEQPAERIYNYLEHILMVHNFRSEPSVAYVSATVEVIEVHLRELFKHPGQMSIKAVQTMQHFFSHADVDSPSSWNVDIGYQSINRMLQFLVSDFSFSDFPRDLQASLHELYQFLSTLLLPRVSTVQSDFASTGIVHQCIVLKLWCSLLSSGRWLGLTEMPISLEKMHLKAARMPTLTPSQTFDSKDNIRVASFAILLQELHYSGQNHLPYLQAIIATYVVHSRAIGITERQQMDNHFSKTCGTLSTSNFSHMLDVIYESLANIQTSTQELTPLVQLSMILLRDHPPHTLKHTQHFAARCIGVFADRDTFTDGPLDLRLQALEFILRHCSDRSAALRLVDVCNIWTLLSRLLSGSRIHDDDTTVAVFHKSVAIVGALVRLRRDLLNPTLPHLGGILRQLMLSMRRVRPHIGAKQTALVTDTQPRYINVKSPLGSEEAKLLARLLEMLTSKTTIRSNAMNTDAQKAESLAKPFSKHAAYVLKAYIDAMNDPLCIIPSSLRKEIQSGLYALCSMIKDYSRDAMMVSALDAGGKTTMKMLWKEYEKQKYIGKG